MEQQIHENSTSQTGNANEEEIDLLALVLKVWGGRKIIVRSILLGGLLGLIIAFSTSSSYTARTILVPQMNTDSKTSGLSGLAALAGINVGISQTSSEISPLIYPLIIKSIPFQLEMMKTPLQFKGSSNTITYLEYLTKGSAGFSPIPFLKKYTLGLLLKWLNGTKKESALSEGKTDIVQLTDDEKLAKKELESIISLVFNVKEGYATLTADMVEPIPAAQMAQKAEDLLQRYIIDFKILKSKADLDFIQERFDEKRVEFEKAQEGLAVRIDRNKNFTSGLSSVETDRLQAKYTLTFGVYQELAKQLEQAKIQVKKETPVFSVIEPVTIPSEKSKPNRPMIIISCIIFGGILGTVIIFGKEFIEPFKKKWSGNI